MEGVSGEGMRRRRREYGKESEDTQSEDMSASEMFRERIKAREASEESSETDESGEVSAKEVVKQAIERLREKEFEEGDISRKVEGALEDLERMERANESTEDKIRDALESIDEKEEELERKKPTAEASEGQDESKESSFGEIKTKEEYDQTVENHSDLKLRKNYENDEREAAEYFEKLERGEDTERPAVVEEVEKLELRRMYETIHDDHPKVSFESMKDVDDLLEKFPRERERAGFDEKYRHCEVYFEVKDKHEEKRDDLAEQYGVSHTFIGYCRNGIEPHLIKKLREHEEERIIEEWAKDSPQFEEFKTIRESETREVMNMDEVVKRVEPHKVRESVEKIWEYDDLSSDRLTSTIEQMLRNESGEKHPVQYADFRLEIDSKHSAELERFIQSNRREIEETLTQKLGLEDTRARVAYVDDRMYTWIPKNRADELVGAYETEFYYFRDRKEVNHIVDELRKQIGLEESSHKSLKHLNEVLRQLNAVDDEVPARKKPVSELSPRLEGRVVRFYLDATDRKLSDLEERVTKVTGINGQAGIENPKFPDGMKLETLKARLAAIIASDCHLRESGRIGYNEEHLDRIARVQEILNNFGDIPLEPRFRKGIYEVHIRNQIGLIMIHEGMTPGNKTIKNPGLPEGFHGWSEEARRAYLEELIPEDGNFLPKRGFSWFRNHALYDKGAIEKYGFTSQLATEEIELIKEKGNQSRGLIDQYELSYGELDRLQQSSNNEKSRIAKHLMEIVSNSPNNLIEDEKKIAESLGIKIRLSPTSLKYYPKSDRVSIKYTACTGSKEDAVRWGEICPPNDERKRNEVELWLRKVAEGWLDSNSWIDW